MGILWKPKDGIANHSSEGSWGNFEATLEHNGKMHKLNVYCTKNANLFGVVVEHPARPNDVLRVDVAPKTLNKIEIKIKHGKAQIAAGEDDAKHFKAVLYEALEATRSSLPELSGESKQTHEGVLQILEKCRALFPKES